MSLDYWKKFFTDTGVSETDIRTYAALFVNNYIVPDILCDILETDLNKIGISKVGHVKLIMKQIKKLEQKEKPVTSTDAPGNITVEKVEKLEERLTTLEREIMELKLETALIYVGEAASLLKTERQKPKSAPQFDGNCTTSARSSRSRSEEPSKKKNALPPLTPTNKAFLETLSNVRHVGAHRMTTHRTTTDDTLNEKIADIEEAEIYFTKNDQTHVVEKYIPLPILGELKNKKEFLSHR